MKNDELAQQEHNAHYVTLKRTTIHEQVVVVKDTYSEEEAFQKASLGDIDCVLESKEVATSFRPQSSESYRRWKPDPTTESPS